MYTKLNENNKTEILTKQKLNENEKIKQNNTN